MTLRPLRTHPATAQDAPNALDYEIAQEQAAALGRMGRALEQALAALAAFDADRPAPRAARDALVRQASDALWHFIVQREASGLRDSRQVMRDYGVPAEVQARMGAFAGKAGPRA